MVWRRAAAGREGRGRVREKWSVHLAGLALTPVLSAGATLILGRALRLDRLTALTAGVGIGCGMPAFAATALVGLRLIHARDLLRRGPRGADVLSGAQI